MFYISVCTGQVGCGGDAGGPSPCSGAHLTDPGWHVEKKWILTSQPGVQLWPQYTTYLKLKVTCPYPLQKSILQSGDKFLQVVLKSSQ